MQARDFAVLLLFSLLVSIAAFVMFYFFIPQESPGRGYGGGVQPYVWIPLAVVPLTLIIGFLAYLALFPEIKHKPPTEAAPEEKHQPIQAVIQVLKEDERKVVELLLKNNGTMLQKDIGRQSGFSRVKTHRILYRLSARGIVTAEKYYNTYRVTLASWLLPQGGKEQETQS